MKRLCYSLLGCGILLPLSAQGAFNITTLLNGSPAKGQLTEIAFDGDMVNLTFGDGSTATADMQEVSISIIYSESSALEAVEADSSLPTGVFNLKGERIAESTDGLAPGLYISNGKKIIVK